MSINKRIIPLISAATCLLSAVGMSANAVEGFTMQEESQRIGVYDHIISKSDLSGHVKGYEKIDAYSSEHFYCYYKASDGSENDYLFSRMNNYLFLDDIGLRLCIGFPIDADREKLSALLEEYMPGMNCIWDEQYRYINNEPTPYLGFYGTYQEYSADAENAVRNLYDEIKQHYDIYHYLYNKNIMEVSTGQNCYGIGELTYPKDTVKDPEAVQAYLDETDSDMLFTLDETYSKGNMYLLAPQREMTVNEIFDTAKKLEDKFDISFRMWYGLESVGSNLPPSKVETIDVLNSTDGDANCDNELSIA